MGFLGGRFQRRPRRRDSTYGRRRLWITFWRRFSGVFLGDFLEPIGPGAGARADFSADGVLLVRWASADLGPFSTFFAFLDRFLPVFGPFFALFPSMSCAYLYVHNFPRTHVSRFGQENLASDKETAEATRPLDHARAALSKVEGRNALSGRELTAKGAKDAKGGLGEPDFVPARRDYAVACDKRHKAKPPKGRRERRKWGSVNGEIRPCCRWAPMGKTDPPTPPARRDYAAAGRGTSRMGEYNAECRVQNAE